MSGNKSIVNALRRLGESGDTAEGPQSAEICHAARQDFMDVGLMTHVKDQAIPGRVKDQMECQCQFDNTQVGGQMAAGPGNMFHQEMPDLRAEFQLLLMVQTQQVFPGMDRI